VCVLPVSGEDLAERGTSTPGGPPRRPGSGFTELANGFASTDNPDRLQGICGGLGPGAIRVFAERWWARLPLPLTAADRAAGYWWEISMRQVEVSRTIVFDAHIRAFFEALLVDNLDVGRPEEMQIVFGRRVRTDPPGGYRSRLLQHGDQVTLNAYFRRGPPLPLRTAGSGRRRGTDRRYRRASP